MGIVQECVRVAPGDGKLTDRVATRLAQHKAGRAATAEILRLSEPDTVRDAD